MSSQAPNDARENGLEQDIDPLAPQETLEAQEVERRLREQTEKLIRHEWEHGPGKDAADPLGASHL